VWCRVKRDTGSWILRVMDLQRRFPRDTNDQISLIQVLRVMDFMHRVASDILSTFVFAIKTCSCAFPKRLHHGVIAEVVKLNSSAIKELFICLGAESSPGQLYFAEAEELCAVKDRCNLVVYML
jgi:hypothetical protein